VTEIKQQVQSIHLGDELVSQFTQAAVGFFYAAVAHEIAQVICRLHDAHPQVGEYREVLQISLEHCRVLAAVNYSQALRGLCCLDVRATQNLHE
jgi:hypothetical protein